MTHQERMDYIRIILGGIDQTALPDATLNLFLTRWELYFKVDQHPEKEPLVLWNTCVSCLEWLIAKSTINGENYTSRSEKIGDEQITVSGGSQIDAWKNLLDYITENPEYVDPTLSARGLTVIVGGVRQSIVDSVMRDPESRGWNKVDSVVEYGNRSWTRDTDYVYHLRDYD